MQQILVFLLVLVAIALVTLILLQRSKAGIGTAFGSGASNTVFGSRGSSSFLLKLTLVFAVAFFVICITLARMAVDQGKAMQAMQLKRTNTQPTTPIPSSTKKNSVNSSVPTVPINK